MSNYVPGQGYKDGYEDRMSGKQNRFLINFSEEHYWQEYKLGYEEASRRVLEDARHSVNSKSFLVE